MRKKAIKFASYIVSAGLIVPFALAGAAFLYLTSSHDDDEEE